MGLANRGRRRTRLQRQRMSEAQRFRREREMIDHDLATAELERAIERAARGARP